MSIYSPSFISFNILINTLCPSSLFTCYTCPCFVVSVVNKLRLRYEGTPKYLGESVTGIKLGLRKQLRGSDVFIVTRDSGIDAGRCTDELWHILCTYAVVFLLEDQSRWSWHHKMMSQWSLMLFWEGTIKGEHIQTLGLSSGILDTEQLGPLTSHRPSTLAIWVPLVEQSITRRNCVLYLSICMYPDFLGNLLVSMTLVVWC